MTQNTLYTLTKEGLKVVKGLVEAVRSAPPPSMLPPTNRNFQTAPDAYWALPPCETGLPAATREDGEVFPGEAVCCLFRLDEDQKKLIPVLDGIDLPVKVLVYNHYALTTTDFVQVFRHKNGYWTNERPQEVASSSSSTTSTQPPDISPRPVCQGECLFTVGFGVNGLVWKPAQGGCSNTTTSSTTTTTTTSTTTSSTTTTSTTPAPCSYTPCRLRCMPVTTTTGSPSGSTSTTTTSWPQSWQPSLRYVVVSDLYNFPCAEPCSCYGAGDPCFLEEGEVLSQCLVVSTTTSTTSTTTTTPTPGEEACSLAAAAVPAIPGEYRAAIWKGGVGGWAICQDCPTGQVPLLKVGSVAAFDPGPTSWVMIHDTPCVDSPCAIDDSVFSEGYAGFKAFGYADQVFYWGGRYGSESLLFEDGEKFAGNWVQCQSCPAGTRPSASPPKFIFYQDVFVNGVTESPIGVYLFESPCVPGPPCETCESSPLNDYLPINQNTTTTGTTSTPPTTSTTTPVPCGCEPPTFCPVSASDCVRTICRPGGASMVGITCPTTTPGPGKFVCYDTTYNQECVCGSSTTSTTIAPCSGSCSAQFVRNTYVLVSTCQPGCSCELSYPSTTPPCGTIISGVCNRGTTTTIAPCTACNGGCLWFAVYEDGYGSSLRWQKSTGGELGGCYPVNNNSTNCKCPPHGSWPSVGGYEPDCLRLPEGVACCCACYPPATPPTSICDVAETGCQFRSIEPCACCTTQACDKQCTFRGNLVGGWVKIDDPCPSTCPCPSYPSTRSGSDCEIRRYTCGSVLPTTQTSAPTTTGTTVAPQACCFLDAACEMLTPQQCIARYGSPQGPGSTCETADCPTTPVPTGACCYPSGGSTFCATETQADCLLRLGSVWYGGQNCDSFTCPPIATTTAAPALGRCCRYSYLGTVVNCQVQTQAQCAQLTPVDDYTTWTANATCGPDACPPATTTTTTSTTPVPLGRCCFGTGHSLCASGQTESWCDRASGYWVANETCAEASVPCGPTTTTTTTAPVTTVTVPPLFP
jgi:hypothetical protein